MILAASEELPSLIIPVPDFHTLRLIASGVQNAGAQAATATWLRGELDRATVVMPETVPGDVVPMHARVEYRDDVTDQIARVTLVYPGEDHWDEQCVSVLSPLGAALLGLSEGQCIRWRTAAGWLRRVTALRVLFQPYRTTTELARRGL